MIECGYFWGLTKAGFLKEIKMNENQHNEDQIPKIGELFTGRYSDDEPTFFTGLSVAFKDNERVFVNKNNQISVVNSEKVLKKLSDFFQSLINELSALKSGDASDYSFISKNEHRNIEKENTSYNLELIKDIEEVYNIQAQKVDSLDIGRIKSEMNNILLVSSMLGFPSPEDEHKFNQFNRSVIGSIATGLTYGKIFNTEDVYATSMGIFFTRSDEPEEYPSVSFYDLTRSFEFVKISKHNIAKRDSSKPSFRMK